MYEELFDKRELFAYTLYMNIQKELIKNKGLRVTPARVAVLDVLYQTGKPLDISQIYEYVLKRHVDADQATIYRIIENFMQKGIISKLQFQEKKFFYEVVRDDHHHAVCRKCAKIEDVSKCNSKRLEKEIFQLTGFSVESHSMEFYGLCRECQ